MTSRQRGLGLATITALISGVAVFLNSNGVRAFGDATTYTTLKNLVAALVLAGVAVAAARRRGPKPRSTRPLRPATRLGLAAIGVIGGSVPFVLFFEGLARATASDAAFLHKTLVVWVALLAVPLLGERVGRVQLAAIALLMSGQVLLAGGLPVLAAGSGELLILVATLLWAAEVIVAKRVLGEVAPLTVGLTRMGVGGIVLVGWTVVSRGPAVLTALTATQAGWAILTGVILAAYVATWLAALSHAPAVDVSAVLVGGAVVTATLETVFRGASLAPSLPGVAALTAGVALVLTARRRPALAAT